MSWGGLKRLKGPKGQKGLKRLGPTGVALSLLSLLSLVSLAGFADIVHVTEQVSLDGAVSPLSDKTLATGRRYATSDAPAQSGWRFTRWSISTAQAFSPRDDWGRAFDAAAFTLYENTTLTAHYVPADRDDDGDGLPDGWELYWFGDTTAQGAGDDPDGDGANNAAEFAANSNPLFPEQHDSGPVLYADGDLWLYNPSNYAAYTIRSEPEGVLFETTTAYAKPGTKVTTGTLGTATAGFACWKVNGVEQRDDWGRAVDAVSLTMTDEPVEIVAVTVSGDSDGDGLPDSWERYWFGSLTAQPDDDPDGDGASHAAEHAAGTNPLMAEAHEEGPIRYVDSELWQYNPANIQPCTIRSDPEGALFETTVTYARKGTKATTGTLGPATVGFACWKVNGVEQRDDWGRASDSVSLTMSGEAVEIVAAAVFGDSDGDGIADNVEHYWYGDLDEGPESDTDGDGQTFAEEIAAGTNPLMAEAHEEGPVRYADAENQELNLQVYEQAVGALVENEFVQLFTSPIVSNDATSVTFMSDGSLSAGGEGGAAIWPVVADVNGDGLWDMIVCSATATNVFVNVGKKGNPRFSRGSDVLVASAGTDLLINSTAKLAAMSLDVEPVGALSATTNGLTLLVSDEDGRIWLYEGTGTNYQLRHKVWGGSYGGFARGLTLAAVDWEDDGDLDCLCGTADGKLMLLRDPKVGRPSNLYALAGVDNVLLEWDPMSQPRVRGYNVYRSEADADDYVRLTTPYIPLPTYRDYPPAIRDYDYKVTSVSRFYQAGYSTPIASESLATEPVRAELGRVSLGLGDTAGFVGREVEVPISVNNSLNLSGDGLSLSFAYDPEILTPVEVRTSALTEGVSLQQNVVDNVWTLTGTGGAVAPGTGVFLTLVFQVAADAEADDAAVELTDAALRSTSGFSVIVPTPVYGVIRLEVPESSDPSYVPGYDRGDLDGDGRLGWSDMELMQKWKDVRYQDLPPEAVRAGDYNGDGVLDNRDYGLMRRDFREREKQGGDMKGWDANHQNGGKTR